MNRLQEVIDKLIIRDTSVLLYGGKQTVFALYGISKTQIGEPVILIDRAYVQSIKQELKHRNTDRNTNKNRDNV